MMEAPYTRPDHMSLIDIKWLKMLSFGRHLCKPFAMREVSNVSKQITLRAATIADAPAITEIYAQHVRTGTASFDTVPPTVRDTGDKIAAVLNAGLPFLVAELDGALVGYAYITRFRERPAYNFTCENSIYVRADQVGLGIGAYLMADLMVRAEACGFRQMIAVIGGGEPASVALHTKMGFSPIGRLRSVGRKFGRWLDSVLMQAELGEGDRAVPAHEPG